MHLEPKPETGLVELKLQIYGATYCIIMFSLIEICIIITQLKLNIYGNSFPIELFK